MRKTALITGCSSGFGRLTARTFHERGWNVAATMRSPERETELTRLDDTLVTRLNVIDTWTIQTAVAETVDRFGAIDVLVNNAGYGGHALFEQASDESIRAMYETNVFGLMNVTREVLPLMRKQGSGCVINVTSMAGMMGFPTGSIYVSSKHAVEGLTEALALEYKPLNIQIKSVLPGAYPTTQFNVNVDNDLGQGDEQLVAHADALSRELHALAEQMANEGGAVADPQEVAERIFECATTSTPIHNPVGADAEMLVAMMSAGPRQSFLEQLEAMVLPAAK
ncbi:MAG: SDR family oxidoreductase [Planctomycetota bacterium]